jgi:hypothetical protein
VLCFIEKKGSLNSMIMFALNEYYRLTRHRISGQKGTNEREMLLGRGETTHGKKK